MQTLFSRMIMRPLIAAAIAASLVLSPISTSSVQAHGRHTGNDNFVAALVALGLLGLIITNEAGKNGNNTGGNQWVPQSKRLPGECLKTFRTTHGNKSYFGRSCLKNNFRWWRNLPDACEKSIRVRNHNGHISTRYVYRPRCLRDYGYRVEAH